MILRHLNTGMPITKEKADKTVYKHVGGGGVLINSLGGGVPIVHWNPSPVLDHYQFDFETLFKTRHQKLLPQPRCPEKYVKATLTVSLNLKHEVKFLRSMCAY